MGKPAHPDTYWREYQVLSEAVITGKTAIFEKANANTRLRFYRALAAIRRHHPEEAKKYSQVELRLENGCLYIDPWPDEYPVKWEE